MSNMLSAGPLPSFADISGKTHFLRNHLMMPTLPTPNSSTCSILTFHYPEVLPWTTHQERTHHPWNLRLAGILLLGVSYVRIEVYFIPQNNGLSRTILSGTHILYYGSKPSGPPRRIVCLRARVRRCCGGYKCLPRTYPGRILRSSQDQK